MDRDVPLDARIFVSSPAVSVESVRLVRASDGEEVPVSLQPTGGPEHTRWLVPDAPLEPDTLYHVVAGSGQGAPYTQLYTQRRTASPQVPTLAGVVQREDGGPLRSLCGSSVGAAFGLVDAQLEGQSIQRTLVKVDVEGLASGPRRLFLPPATADLAFGHFLEPAGTASTRNCLADAELGPLEPGAVQVQVRLWDRSGQVSEPVSTPLTLRAVPPAGCGPVQPPQPGTTGADAGTAPPPSDATGPLGKPPPGFSCTATATGACVPALALLALMLRRRTHLQHARR